MVEKVYKEIEEKMESSLEVFRKDLNTIRTGRASLSLLDGVTVDYYGNPTPLNQVATLSVPESRSITIQPWDNSIIGAIEKAILKSDLGLTPINDGKIIRISIPPLTEERRKELVKVVKKYSEECKIAIRNIRREGNESLKSLEKDGEISEDEFYKSQRKIQEDTDSHIEKTDEITKKKEIEILEF
ncbi:MAG TPA: ribosome recycling factor [Nitrospinota bacterium]|nr:ribosome recycling factor [Nitrospinota bacterium]